LLFISYTDKYAKSARQLTTGFFLSSHFPFCNAEVICYLCTVVLNYVLMDRGGGKVQIRLQSGCFHVILNSNFQNIIFSDDIERIQFLIILHKYLKKYNCKIYAFCLMHTHIHLLIETSQLSRLMQCVLHDYSFWYNRRIRQKGNIFRRPFISYPKYSAHSQLDTALYILRNPYVQGLSSHPRNYYWSSYNFYFGTTRLEKCIKVDPSLIRNAFGNSSDFYRTAAIIPQQPPKIYNKSRGKFLSDELVMNYTKELLDGKSPHNLTQDQVERLIIHLKKIPGVSIRQISSVLYVSQNYVRRVTAAHS
jgi:REP element-mobilizing transposase RayT